MTVMKIFSHYIFFWVPIFFRYLFLRLLQPFLVCLTACTIIWVMVDLYGNMDDFLDHKVGFGLVLRFYALQIPGMLVQVLPATMLFAALFTLMALNRRSELVALQSGGMAPLWMFSPFFLFAVLWMGVLAWDMYSLAAGAQVNRDRILRQVKGDESGRGVFKNLIYVDTVNHLVWMFQDLDAGKGRAQGVELLQRDAQGHDMIKYFAQHGEFTSGKFWRLTGVKELVYHLDGANPDQKTLDALDLPDVTTPPKQMSLIISQPEQLTTPELAQYINASTQSVESKAKYRTEWWRRQLYPFSMLVLILFALSQGTRSDRRSAVAGLGVAIVVLFGFTMATGVFMAMGRNNRLPPMVAAGAAEVIFGLLGLYLLAVNNGWFWQLHELWKKFMAWYESDDDDLPEPPPKSKKAAKYPFPLRRNF
jgi:lipopolysaccharide export system permease protein